jgi:inosine-uridine nucleoside N-ribohydrolase
MTINTSFPFSLSSRHLGLVCAVALMLFVPSGLQADELAPEPVRLIFDTDIGNDVDDALAMAVIHALQSRGQCELLAVTCTKDNPLCGPLVDAINTFYGRGDIPVGVVRDGATPDEGKFLGLASEMQNGKLRYPHDLPDADDIPDATQLLRDVLAGQPDASVVIAQVGFSTNLARLLDSKPDKHSPLSGIDLVAKKVKLLSIMAGAFRPIEGIIRHREYNVVKDLPSTRKVIDEWPTEIVISGFEIGRAITYPHESIDRDYNYHDDHLIAEAYRRYCEPGHDRPCWDLTSVLYGVQPGAGYFTLSHPGRIILHEDGFTTFDERRDGHHRYLIANREQIVRTREALVQLSSQPPDQTEPVQPSTRGR